MNRLSSFWSSPPPRRSRLSPTAAYSTLLDLVRLRVAQIHRCDVGETHYRTKLQQAGVALARLQELESWPMSDIFNGKERVVLALTELLAQSRPNESLLLPRLLHEAHAQLSRTELVQLVVAVEAMQDWELHREDLRA